MNLILKNASFLLIGNFGVRLITASTAILLARYLDATAYGTLSVALALASIGDFFARMCLTQTTIREGKKPNPDLPRIFGGSMKLRLFFSLATTLFFAAFIPLFYDDPTLRLIAYLIVLPTIWGGNFRSLGELYFQITEQMQYTAMIRAVPQITTGLLLLACILFQASLPVLASSHGIASLVGGIVGVWIVFRRVPDMHGWHWGLLQGIGAFLLGGIFSLLLGQLGPLVLEKATGLKEVGYFSVAYRVPAFLYTFPGALASAFYPQLFYLGARDLDQHFRLNAKEIKSMTLIGLCLALPFAMYPEWVIGTFFGQRWVAEASQPLAILSWMAVFHCINFPLADALTTRGLQSRRTTVIFLGLVAGFALFSTLGSKWGALGGAIAALSLEGCLIAGYVLMNPSRKRLFFQCLVPMLLLISASYCAGVIVRYLINFEPAGFILLPILSFTLVMIFDREVRDQTINIVQKWRRKKWSPESP